MTIELFRAKLLNWYAGHRRPLPWRNNPTPYRVWISEIMLQQTQAKSVLRYYDRFMKRFPDLESLAQASEAEVLELWSGLGYYSRAKNIHKAAKLIRKRHESFPKEFSSILALPGIGRYTAGAILSIAFNQPYPVVDGNIRRVIARLNGQTAYFPESYFWETMSGWIPESAPSHFNQAMMELGALVCIPSKPLCPRCPVRSLCKAKELGLENTIPRIETKVVEKMTIAVLVLERKGRILVCESDDRSFIPGNWELPWQIVDDEAPAITAALNLCQTILGLKLPLRALGEIRHTITNRRINVLGYCGMLERQLQVPKPERSARFVPRASIRKFLTSSLFLKVLAAGS